MNNHFAKEETHEIKKCNIKSVRDNVLSQISMLRINAYIGTTFLGNKKLH